VYEWAVFAIVSKNYSRDAVRVFRQMIIQKNKKRRKKIPVCIFEIRCISILLHS
jgi:hypothetical protein